MPKFLSSLRGALRRSNLLIRNLSFIIHDSLPFGQKGQSSAYSKGASSAYIILFVIVVIFAVMMSGGASSLFSGNHPSSVIDTPTPPGGAATTAPATGSWNISVTLDGCKNDKAIYMAGTAKVEGPSDGTVELSVGTQTVGSQVFKSPSGTFPLSLSNDSGFNTKVWKIKVSSGGSIKKTYEGNPTGCT